MKHATNCALVLLFAATVVFAQEDPRNLLPEPAEVATAFPVPKRIVALSAAITPREHAEIIAAIKREMAKPKVSEELDRGPGLGDLKHIVVTRVPLGNLGDSMLVDFRGSLSGCGTGGCPMWLFLRGTQGYRNVIKDGGWGFALLPSGGPVPDVAFYWQMGAGETDVSQYHYQRGKFSCVTANPEKCDGEDDTRGACAGRSSQPWVSAITPAEYESLGREIRPGSKASAPASQSNFSADAHAIDFPLVNDIIARVVGVGTCNPHSNCSISIYGCHQTYSGPAPTAVPHCEYWPMVRDVSGWGVANVSDLTTDPFSARVAFVFARRLTANEVELSRYSIASPPTGPQPGSKLSPDACQIVNLDTANATAQWYAAASLTNPRPCPNTAPAPDAALKDTQRP